MAERSLEGFDLMIGSAAGWSGYNAASVARRGGALRHGPACPHAPAASGAQNREIAQALFVTTATVEFHLRNAYRKLGISGRPGLAEALA